MMLRRLSHLKIDSINHRTDCVENLFSPWKSGYFYNPRNSHDGCETNKKSEADEILFAQILFIYKLVRREKVVFSVKLRHTFRACISNWTSAFFTGNNNQNHYLPNKKGNRVFRQSASCHYYFAFPSHFSCKLYKDTIFERRTPPTFSLFSRLNFKCSETLKVMSRMKKWHQKYLT